jgi:hypothetical protein
MLAGQMWVCVCVKREGFIRLKFPFGELLGKKGYVSANSGKT